MKVPEMSSLTSKSAKAVNRWQALGVTPIKSNKSQGAARNDRNKRRNKAERFGCKCLVSLV